jgi:hypothetical protein
LSHGGSGYFTCIQNMKLVTNKFKSGGLHEKHVVNFVCWVQCQRFLTDTGKRGDFSLTVWHAFVSGRQGLPRQRAVLLSQEMNEA